MRKILSIFCFGIRGDCYHPSVKNVTIHKTLLRSLCFYRASNPIKTSGRRPLLHLASTLKYFGLSGYFFPQYTRKNKLQQYFLHTRNIFFKNKRIFNSIIQYPKYKDVRHAFNAKCRLQFFFTTGVPTLIIEGVSVSENAIYG